MFKVYLRLILYIAVFAAVFINTDPYLASAVLLTTGGLMVVLPDSRMRKGLIPTAVLTGVTFVGNLFFLPGKVIFHVGGLAVTEQSLQVAIVRASRVAVLVVAAKVLFLGASAEEFINALKRLFRPFQKLGLPVEEFFDTTLLTIKKIPELKDRVLQAPTEKGLPLVTRIGRVSTRLYQLLIDELKEEKPDRENVRQR